MAWPGSILTPAPLLLVEPLLHVLGFTAVGIRLDDVLGLGDREVEILEAVERLHLFNPERDADPGSLHAGVAGEAVLDESLRILRPVGLEVELGQAEVGPENDRVEVIVPGHLLFLEDPVQRQRALELDFRLSGLAQLHEALSLEEHRLVPLGGVAVIKLEIDQVLDGVGEELLAIVIGQPGDARMLVAGPVGLEAGVHDGAVDFLRLGKPLPEAHRFLETGGDFVVKRACFLPQAVVLVRRLGGFHLIYERLRLARLQIADVDLGLEAARMRRLVGDELLEA